ncbi:MAG: hypothetical protein ACI3VB_04545 [Oscillospiraceae bacterium]
MAAGTAKAEYAQNAVYGNVAYDLSTAGYAIPREDRTIPAERPQERVRERAREEVQAAPREKAAFGVPVAGIIGVIAAAALMVFVLLAYVQLNEISSETSQLKSAISELTETGTRLRVTYESTFNLNEIEDYAINILGMTKLKDSCVTVFASDKTDKAEILNADDSAKGLISRASEFIGSLAEYFG